VTYQATSFGGTVYGTTKLFLATFLSTVSLTALLSSDVLGQLQAGIPVWSTSGPGNAIVTPVLYGALCNNIADDHVALQAWANALGAGIAGQVNGYCKTSTPINFPDVNGVTVNGFGTASSQLIYTGANTVNNIVNFGGTRNTTNLLLQNITFDSAIIMTAGATLHIQNNSDSTLRGIAVGATVN
jgi:hypothetical protein